jgi:hypothetical protein
MKTILTKPLRSSPGDWEENELPRNDSKTMRCVCSGPSVMRGVTVKHVLTSTSSPPNDIPFIPWSPVVLPLWTPGGLARAVSNRLEYLGCRTPWQLLLGNSTTWALVPSSQSTLEPRHGNQLREEGQSKLNIGAIVVTCQYSARCYGAVQRL